MYLRASLSCVNLSGSVIRGDRSTSPLIRERGVLTVIRQTSAASQHVRHASQTTAGSTISLTALPMHQASSNYLVRFVAFNQLMNTLLF
jgi:hypothetical protein